jgi:hypothetical protein
MRDDPQPVAARGHRAIGAQLNPLVLQAAERVQVSVVHQLHAVRARDRDVESRGDQPRRAALFRGRSARRAALKRDLDRVLRGRRCCELCGRRVSW